MLAKSNSLRTSPNDYLKIVCSILIIVPSTGFTMRLHILVWTLSMLTLSFMASISLGTPPHVLQHGKYDAEGRAVAAQIYQQHIGSRAYLPSYASTKARHPGKMKPTLSESPGSLNRRNLPGVGKMIYRVLENNVFLPAQKAHRDLQQDTVAAYEAFQRIMENLDRNHPPILNTKLVYGSHEIAIYCGNPLNVNQVRSIIHTVLFLVMSSFSQTLRMFFWAGKLMVIQVIYLHLPRHPGRQNLIG